MRTCLAALVSVCALVVAGPIGALNDPSAPSPSVAAPKCKSGYRYAVLPWGRRCLKRGLFCSILGDRHYHRYGFHCHTGRLS